MTTNPRPSPPTTQTDLETDLLTHLLTTPALDDLHSTLLAALQRTGWTEKIRRLAQELLRGGRCERFDEVIEAVVASAEGRRHPSLLAATSKKNGAAAIKDEDDDDDDDDDDGAYANGKKKKKKNNNGDNANNAAYFETVDVRIPSAVVEQGVRAIKEVLREVVVLEGDGDGVGDSSSSAAAGDGGDKDKEHTATTTTRTPGQKDRVKGVKNGETNGSGASGSPVKKGEKKMKPKQGK